MSGSGERERGEDSEVRGKEEAVVDAERGRALRFVPQSVSAPVTFPPPRCVEHYHRLSLTPRHVKSEQISAATAAATTDDVESTTLCVSSDGV